MHLLKVYYLEEEFKVIPIKDYQVSEDNFDIVHAEDDSYNYVDIYHFYPRTGIRLVVESLQGDVICEHPKKGVHLAI